MVASMRLVTQRTIFSGGGVLPQIRPLLFGVAGVAGFIDGGLLQQKIIVAIVRVVTVAAGHIAKS